MCLASVTVAGEPPPAAPIATEVARITPTDGGLLVTDLLGNSQTIEARIESIDFLESTVVVRRSRLKGAP